MFVTRSLLSAGLLFAFLCCGSPSAHAQWNGGCSSCGQQPAPFAPLRTGFAGFWDPCGMQQQQVAYGQPQLMACMQPVSQTVYREMPVTEYRTVQKTIKQPKVVTEWQERKVTAYRTAYETKVAEVPEVQYQTVTENRPTMINRSHWKTVWQPVAKAPACQYDARPGLLGGMNRFGYSVRQAMTPNSVPRREYVPNVCMYNVPVQRQVAVPTTRQVTYNVAKLVPYETTERVAVNKVVEEDVVVTVQEPYTVTKTVAVGTTTSYAWAGDPATLTALGLTPTVTAQAPNGAARTADGSEAQPTPAQGAHQLQSYERPAPAPTPAPRNRAQVPAEGPVAQAAPAPIKLLPTHIGPPKIVRSVASDSGWRPSQRKLQDTTKPSGPTLSVVAK